MKARSKPIPKEILRSFFETNQYPTKPQKEELTNKTGFSLRKVSFWFNDERKKHGISKGKPAVVECGKCTFHSSQKYVMAEHKYREHGCKLCDFKSHDRTAVRYHTLTMHRAHGERAIDCKLSSGQALRPGSDSRDGQPHPDLQETVPSRLHG